MVFLQTVHQSQPNFWCYSAPWLATGIPRHAWKTQRCSSQPCLRRWEWRWSACGRRRFRHLSVPSSNALAKMATPAARCLPAIQWQIALSPWKTNCRSIGHTVRHCWSTVTNWQSGSWMPPLFSRSSGKHLICIDNAGKCWSVSTTGTPESQSSPPEEWRIIIVGASAIRPRVVGNLSKCHVSFLQKIPLTRWAPKTSYKWGEITSMNGRK